MTGLLPFEGPRLKTLRARRHIAELSDGIGSFLATKPFRLVVERPDSLPAELKSHVWVFRINEPIPSDFSTVIGDAIHKLRTTLDLLACDLVRVAGKNGKNVYFPFCAEADQLDAAIQSRDIHLAGVDVVEVIRSLKPYRGGNAALRAIHDLDIDGKHKAMIPVIGIAETPPLLMRIGNRPNAIPPFASSVERDGQWFVMTPEELNLSLGTEISALFKLVFPGGTALAGCEIIPTLHQLTNLVDGIVNALAALRPGATFPID